MDVKKQNFDWHFNRGLFFLKTEKWFSTGMFILKSKDRYENSNKSASFVNIVGLIWKLETRCFSPSKDPEQSSNLKCIDRYNYSFGSGVLDDSFFFLIGVSLRVKWADKFRIFYQSEQPRRITCNWVSRETVWPIFTIFRFDF